MPRLLWKVSETRQEKGIQASCHSCQFFVGLRHLHNKVFINEATATATTTTTTTTTTLRIECPRPRDFTHRVFYSRNPRIPILFFHIYFTMPLVLQRSQRAEDSHLRFMRNEAARKHRSLRLTSDSRAAAEIEYKQKANWERNVKRPLLPRPQTEDGFSTPEWDVARACWISYSIEDNTKWVCWDVFSEKWVDLSEYDRGEFASRESDGVVVH